MARPKLKWENIVSGWDDWEDEILALYGEGAGDAEVKKLIHQRVGRLPSHDLWYRMLKEEPEFSEVIKKGKVLCQAWWEKEGRTNIYNGQFNTTLWIVNVTNRFRDSWQRQPNPDKVKVEHQGKVSISWVEDN